MKHVLIIGGVGYILATGIIQAELSCFCQLQDRNRRETFYSSSQFESVSPEYLGIFFRGRQRGPSLWLNWPKSNASAIGPLASYSACNPRYKTV